MKLSLLGFIDLFTYLERPTVIIGMICFVVGASFALLAGRIANAVNKNRANVSSKVESVLKIVGIFIIVTGFILIAIPS